MTESTKGQKEHKIFEKFEEFLEIIPTDAFTEEISEKTFVNWLDKHIEDQGLLDELKEIMTFNEMNKLILLEIVENQIKAFGDATSEE